MTNDDAWVIIPVFNEATVIAQIVEDLRTAFPHIVCVDDGSTDGSARKIAATGAHLVRHQINLGQGAALQTGLSYALNQPGGRFFVTFDADGQHSVSDATQLVTLARTESLDVVLGSRFLDRKSQVPLLRRGVLCLVAALSPAGRRMGLTDTHNGLRVFHRKVAERLKITMNDMAHASEIVALLDRGGWTVREAPVTIRYTDYSRAKGQKAYNALNIAFDLAVSRLRAAS